MRGTKRQKRDGVWELRVYVGRDSATGKPRQVSKTFRGGARAADAALRELVDRQAPSRTDGVGVTFGQLLDRWIEECERLELSPTTLRNYRSVVEGTLRPRLGKLPLNRLTSKHLDDLYGSMKADGKAPKTIRNLHAMLSSALHQGVRWGWLRANVAELAKPPRVAQHRVNAPSVDDVRKVIVAAEERDPRVAPLLMLGALTGMRRGELCALRWSDINLDRSDLTVSRSVIVTSGGLTEKATKTDRDRRVALDEVAVAVLTRHRQQTDEWARVAGSRVTADSFVFSPQVDGSKPFRPDNVTSFFIRVRDDLGLTSLRLHDLRHFTATQLIAAGVDVRTVAGRLGHSDASVTLRIYAHVLEERDRAAASVMGKLMEPSSSQPADKSSPPGKKRR